MKSLIQTISLFLAILAVVLVFLAGAVLCMHIIFQKENMSQIVDQYMSGSGAETAQVQSGQSAGSDAQSIYDILDSGSASGIDALLSNPNLTALMNSYGSIAEISGLADAEQMNVSQVGGLGGMFSSVGTIIKVAKGEYGLVSLLLNYVDSKKLLSIDVIDEALAAENVAKDYTAPENADQLKQSFLHTKLASRMALEAAYVYYDYFNSAKSAEGWQNRLHTSLVALEGEREQDLSFLLGHAVTEGDRALVESLKSALANAMISEMTSPADKANSLSGGTHLLLNLFFASRIVISLFLLALILVALIFVMQRESGKGLVYFGFVLIFAGILLAIMRFFKSFVIGPFYSDSGSDFKAMMLFVIVGASIAGSGLLILILPTIIRNLRNNKRVKSSKLDANVPSFGEIGAISQMGLSDIVMKSNNNQLRRPDGLIDYYGDGRGLNAQREFKKRNGGDIHPTNANPQSNAHPENEQPYSQNIDPSIFTPLPKEEKSGDDYGYLPNNSDQS